jgi:hypothetical protein
MSRSYLRNNLVELGPSLSGFLDKIYFFSEVGLSDQCPQPSFTLGKNSNYNPGIEPSTSGVAVGAIQGLMGPLKGHCFSGMLS